MQGINLIVIESNVAARVAAKSDFIVVDWVDGDDLLGKTFHETKAAIGAYVAWIHVDSGRESRVCPDLARVQHGHVIVT
jgi:hypothetical protein